MFVNVRILLSPMEGVQRYLKAILALQASSVQQISSAPIIGGITGHLWEQFILPVKSRGHLLWSPSNTGPLVKKNQVVTIHDVAPLDHPEWLSKKFAIWYSFLLPRLVRRVRHVIAVSEFTKTRLIATTKISPDKITVIPNGVDQRFHPRAAADIAAALAGLSLPSSRYVLTVGSLAPRKNLRRLLAAWQAAQENLPNDVWLVLAGGKGKSRIFGEDSGAGQLPPRVHMTGHVPEETLPHLYAGAAAFVYVSLYEGFGLPPLEAMASGVPVVVSSTTAFPEVVGEAGLYADPLDTAAIAAALTKLLLEPALAEKLSALGLERAKHFTWERSADMTMRVLRQAAAA